MIKLIALQGFQAHLDSALELAPGVNVVVGPTDSGKSSIVRGVGWLAFNRPSGDAFVNGKSKGCSVSVLTDRGVALRSRKPKNEYRIDGNVLSAVGKSVPPELAGVLNLDETNVQWQLNPYFLVLDSPGAVSRYITEQLCLDAVDRAVKVVTQDAQSLSTKLALLSEDAGIAIKRLEQLKDLDRYVALLDEVKSMHEKVVSLYADIAELESLCSSLTSIHQEMEAIDLVIDKLDVKTANDLLGALTMIEIRRSEIFEELKAIRSDVVRLASLDDAVSEVNVTIDLIKSQYVDTLSGNSQCPTCFGSIDLDRVRAHL